jgi:DNA-binding CsgD family transcriptional regulator
MYNASHPREHLTTAIQAAAEAVSYDDLGEVALGAAARAVGASNMLLYRYDDNGAVQGVAGTLAAAIPSYARELFDEDPVQRHLMTVETKPRVVLTIHQIDRRAYLRSAAYHEFYRPHDVEHLLGMWLTDLPYGAPGMAGILLTRASRAPDFTEREARVLSRAMPALQAAARRIQRVERALTERRALGALVSAVTPGAHVALDTAGRPLWISPEAETLLAPVLGRGRALPAPLVEAAARVGALAGGDAVDAPPFTVDVSLAGVALRAELRLARAANGECVVVAALLPRVLAVSPRPQRTTLDAIADRHRLTRAEIAVLGCIAEALSNREIAQRLFVSIETVKTHVQRVLAKLEVESRTQAAVMVNRGVLPPAFPLRT